MKINQPVCYKLWEILGDICPVDQSNPTSCPLFFLRKMPSAERLAWFMAQETPDQILKLAVYHQNCKNKRGLI